MRRIPAHQILDAGKESGDPERSRERVLRVAADPALAPAAKRPARIVRAAHARFAEQPRELATYALRNGTSRADAAASEEKRAAIRKQQALRERLGEELRAEFQAELASARQAGFDAGFAAAESEMQSGIEAHSRRLRDTAQKLSDQWTNQLRSAEPALAEMAFRLAEGILEGPLPDDVRRISVRALSSALERLADKAPAEISLHPVDLMDLEESDVTRQLTATHAGLKWIGDDARELGDWEVRCDVAVIRRCASEMLLDLRGQMQLLHLERHTSDA